MHASQIPADFPVRFGHPGSSCQITNIGSNFVPADEQFVYEGAVKKLAVTADDLVVEFEWLAEKKGDGWHFVTDASLLTLRHSLALFASGAAPDAGRFIFMPMVPIVTEQVLFIAHDYVGPTGRTPLARDQVSA